MRSLNGVGRGVFAVVVLCALSMPVQAATSEDWTSRLARKGDRIIKMLKRFGGSVTSLGDGLTVPRP